MDNYILGVYIFLFILLLIILFVALFACAGWYTTPVIVVPVTPEEQAAQMANLDAVDKSLEQDSPISLEAVTEEKDVTEISAYSQDADSSEEIDHLSAMTMQEFSSEEKVIPVSLPVNSMWTEDVRE